MFANPLIAILLIASIVSAGIGEWANATIIVAMVVLGVTINFIQTYHSRRAVERLRKSVAPTATVLRDGHWTDIPRAQVVPGDLIRVIPGDLVPADACIVECEHVHVQEAALTGESVPAEKQVQDSVFLGTRSSAAAQRLLLPPRAARHHLGQLPSASQRGVRTPNLIAVPPSSACLSCARSCSLSCWSFL